ncbi:hypothetical protein E4P42_25585 [Mycobacterium sp. PS03-16]|uniref:2OG-Fe dioxygenase family protein n=1 Tax=Mycobacterium sp. PS03-16 TaxID=2559611 RepID=UPI001073A3A0|nr:2OG-Fe dioxygenase family protein [Mycobacterium sp. PS03-16]TFV54568.1 hypothetical protein E4P42_25585 [Mycobacterium sp. PS03-16]
MDTVAAVTGRDPVADAAQALRTCGAHLIAATDLTRALGLGNDPWQTFGAHWEELAPDPYAAELGTRRLRRYGHYRMADGNLERLPHGPFVQPERSNPLYVGRDRRFEPLTDAFAAEPLLQRLIALLHRLAGVLEDRQVWQVKVTPFRVLATADDEGDPTPEGLHRDGVTLVTSLLIARRNAEGGESTVYDNDGGLLVRTVMCVPGTLLVGDDRRTRHGVSPIRPADAVRPAHRDVLVITFAA